MTAPALTLRVDAASAEALRAHLEACDAEFKPPLSARVDLAAYAVKLRARARTFEAWDGPVLAGLVAAYLDPATRACFVSSVSVLPSHGRRGIGRRLMEACLADARRAGMARLALEVTADVPAVALYEALGLRVERRDGDTLTMALALAGEGGGR